MRHRFGAGLSIRSKVFAGYAILVLPFVALATATWLLTRMIGADAAEMRINTLPVLSALESVRLSALQVIETTNSYALINAIGANEQDRFASFSAGKKQDMHAARREFSAAFSMLQELIDRADGQALLNNIAFAHRNILKQSEKIEALVQSSGRPAALLQLRERFETTARNFRNLIQQAVDGEKRGLAADQATLNNRIRDALLIVVGLSVLGLLLAIAGGYVVSGRIVRPILSLRDVTARVGAGDFDAAPARTSDDEVGELVDAFRSMAQRLKSDISARKASEKAARRAEARLTDAVESIGEGFVLYDSDERLVTCNQRFRDIFDDISDVLVPGARWEDIVRRGVERGQYAASVHHADNWIEERTRRFRHPGEPYEQQLADGRWLRIADRRTSDGGTVGIRTDITGVKDAQFALERAHAELKAATERLAERERLSTMGRLTATVSHELRNPLAAIRTSLATVRGATGGKGLGIERALDRCDRSIERCTAIIEDLLDFTRARELDREVTSFDDWLGQVLDEQEMPPDIVLARDLSAKDNVAIDRVKFRQVIFHLMENAVQALQDPGWEPEPGHRRGIIVRTELLGPSIRFSIIDTGPGMPAEILAHIFEPLFTTKNFGAGLGLPMVRQIVEQHGGTIDVRSSPGDGTAFAIDLPRLTVATSLRASAGGLHAA